MENKVFNFTLNLDWNLLKIVSQIDRFDASWTSIEKKEKQSLKQLKNIATVRSVGASTRIEGSKMSNEEVKVLLDKIDVTKIEDRDAQEVLGYFEVLNLNFVNILLAVGFGIFNFSAIFPDFVPALFSITHQKRNLSNLLHFH